LTRSGLFVSRQRLANVPSKDGVTKILDYKPTLYTVIEVFIFLSRFAEELEVGEELVYEVWAGPLTGYVLLSTDFSISLPPSKPCRASHFRRRKTLTAEALRASWEDECAKTLRGFFELFTDLIRIETLRNHWIERFKQRQLD
jgi:hypothetical protein